MPLADIILIDKPAGLTSFGVVARVRRVFSQTAGHRVKVGHTGTLDPFATGLLILLSGSATKQSNHFLKLDKSYEATLFLGATSTTGDPEGEIVSSSNDFKPTLAQIQQVVAAFQGTIQQTVPAFSAVKINGQRAYKLARRGQDFTPPTRTVQIYQLDILFYQFPILKINCQVSSGTYIRTLAEDLGAKLGTGAYLTALRRTQIGNYHLRDAVSLSEFLDTFPEK